MKKFVILFLYFLGLSFKCFEISTFAVLPTTVFKEGVYRLSDFNISSDNLYYITNASSTEDAYIIIFDENNYIMQSLLLSPSIKSFNLVHLQPNNKIVVLGKAEVFITSKPVK